MYVVRLQISTAPMDSDANAVPRDEEIMDLRQELRCVWAESLECHHLCLLGLNCLQPLGTVTILNEIKKIMSVPIVLAGRRDGTFFALSCHLQKHLGCRTFHACGGVWSIATDESHRWIACGLGKGRVVLFSNAFHRIATRNLAPSSSYILCMAFDETES